MVCSPTVKWFFERYPGDVRVPRLSFALAFGHDIPYLHESEVLKHISSLSDSLWRGSRPRRLDQYDLEVGLLMDAAKHEAVGLGTMVFGPDAFLDAAVAVASGAEPALLRASWTTACLHFAPRGGDQINVQIARESLIDGQFVIEDAQTRLVCGYRDLVRELVALDIRLRRFRVALGEPDVQGVVNNVVNPHLLYGSYENEVVAAVGDEQFERLVSLELSELLTVRI